MNSVELRAVGKRSLEWNLNDWKWDGDLFLASSLNSVPPGTFSRQIFSNGTIPVPGGLSDSSSSCSDDVTMGIEKRKNEIEKRRRITGMEDRALNDEPGGPILKLGSHGYQIPEREVGSWEGSSGKKTKFVGGSSNRAICQVEDCGADLSRAKDYHRRHKVCEMHSKASRALVGNLMQRFCQQCSRFHALQEFDEGKRSCRRRLAGHNKRRRKTNPVSAANGSSPNEDQTSGYLLMSLLRILSNMHSNQSDHSADQDLISHLLRSIAGLNSEHKERDIPVHLQEPQNLQNGRLVGNSELVSTYLSNGAQGPSMPSEQHTPLPLSEMPLQDVSPHDSRSGDTKTISSVKHGTMNSSPAYSELVDCAAVKSKMNNFDLNDIYIDSDDGLEDVETSVLPVHLGTSSLESPWARQDSHQSSPPQTSGNSDSASAQSPSSSSGEAQSRTDRIVIKLFGKDPSEFPLDLRAQVLDWLAHSPTDMESYIKPGCVVLTIYLRQTEEAWEELCYDICCSLNRLLQGSDDTFWRTGWVYARIQHHLAFAFHGQVMVDTSLSLRSSRYCNIVSVKPIAVSASERIRFSVRGSNLKRPGTRLLCALEGKYLTEKATQESTDTEKATQESTDTDSMKEHDDRNELEFISFSCSIRVVNGRGFIEVEDHGFSSSFFPFIVAEDDVCSDIRVLEPTLELTDTSSDATGVTVTEARRQAMDFIHEMGWLLHRKQLNSRLKIMNSNADTYPFDRFKWLMEFSMNRDWCAVVRKLLNILFDGIVSIGDHHSLNEALFEMSLLHRAVRRGSKSLVGIFLSFKPQKVTTENEVVDGFLFRPDAAGPAGLTPLHIAAAKDGSEDVLDALTDDPGMVGIEAWRNARDSTGSTPEDYARLRGHFSYIHLIQKKINKRASSGHVVLDIPGVVHSDHSTNEKQTDNLGSAFEIRLTRPRPNCRVCDKKLSYGKLRPSHSLVYRPAMLSMVAIAAVCVCVALLFKSSPEVLYVFGPFRWDLLDYGTC